MTDTSRVINFGCRLNAWESEVIGEHIRPFRDLVVINSCAVTAESERQVRQTIRRVHRRQPDKHIVVTGCAAQLAPQRWHALPGVTNVVGNREKLEKETWSSKSLQRPVNVSDIHRSRSPVTHPLNAFAARTRACVQIQQGCNHKCTFCIIPQARGYSRSVSIDEVIEQIKRLVESGHREIVLTGVDVASWGGDLEGQPVLGQLCRSILTHVPQLERLRLSSIDPVGIDPYLWELLEDNPRFMPYLHLSLQSGSDLILKRMRRRHNTEDVAQLISRARQINPRIGIGADVIAGFPTEDDALFRETYRFLAQQAIPYLHVFPYSERPGTPAARMPRQVNGKVRRERARTLRELGARHRDAFHRNFIGDALDVLMEDHHRGHSREFIPVKLAGKEAQIGENLSLVGYDMCDGQLLVKRRQDG